MLTIQRRLAAVIALGVLAVLAGSGCGSEGGASGPTSASSASAPSATFQTYASEAFVLPLTVTVDPALMSPPNPDSRNLLSWDAAAADDEKIRFLVPVVVYRPGTSTPIAPPKDYLGYLQSQTKDRVVYRNVTKTTVDGRPATLLSATSTTDQTHPQGHLDGSLGCPARDAAQDEGCFGIQPHFRFRLAVVNVRGTTLVAWARRNETNPDEEFFRTFERMITSVRFR
jgi:hypothetical protein